MIPMARVLTGLASALAVVLALEWLLPGRSAPAASVPLARLHASERAAALPARATAAWDEAILARPVFSISRRPPRVAANGRAEPGPGQARLAGIMITGFGRRAIFAPEGGGHALVLAEGGSVNQTTIRSILADRVVLAGGTVLRPAYDRNRPAGQTTAPFQPIVPSFNPGLPIFQNSNAPFGNGNFPAPGFPQPGFQPGVPPPGVEDGAPVPTPMPPQAFRGTLIPQRRE